MVSPKLTDYIWDFEGAKHSTLIPESKMNLAQFRASCGFRFDAKKGEREYYVPKHLA